VPLTYGYAARCESAVARASGDSSVTVLAASSAGGLHCHPVSASCMPLCDGAACCVVVACVASYGCRSQVCWWHWLPACGGAQLTVRCAGTRVCAPRRAPRVVGAGHSPLRLVPVDASVARSCQWCVLHSGESRRAKQLLREFTHLPREIDASFRGLSTFETAPCCWRCALARTSVRCRGGGRTPRVAARRRPLLCGAPQSHSPACCRSM